MERKAPAFTRLLKEWVKKSLNELRFLSGQFVRFYLFYKSKE